MLPLYHRPHTKLIALQFAGELTGHDKGGKKPVSRFITAQLGSHLSCLTSLIKPGGVACSSGFIVSGVNSQGSCLQYSTQ